MPWSMNFVHHGPCPSGKNEIKNPNFEWQHMQHGAYILPLLIEKLKIIAGAENL
jgi:hypothetical protein